MANLKVSFLDVGHGDFIYCETPLGDNMIIDCGYGDDVTPSIFLKNENTINELQISHPHTDHFDDIIDISKKDIKSFRCPDLSIYSDEKIGWKNNDKKKIDKLRELKKNIPKDDSAVKTDKNFSHLVWASLIADGNDPNTSSLVTLVDFNGFKILFGGDLPKAGWIELLKKDDFKTAIEGTMIFKVPHHGRENGFCEDLFKVISPKLCIVCDKSLDKSNENTQAVEKYSDLKVNFCH